MLRGSLLMCGRIGLLLRGRGLLLEVSWRGRGKDEGERDKEEGDREERGLETGRDLRGMRTCEGGL